ncbi:hypothetical protein GGF42_004561 [Coemansia sp. RSA 2424]|nr:hypothetical protein GGF42_004561 [Coemansia sp. RSA 2424]
MEIFSFSTFGILAGGELNLKEPPIQFIANNPYEYCCAFVVPMGTSFREFSSMIYKADISDISSFNLLLNSFTGVGLVGVQSAEEMAILKESTIVLKGKAYQAQEVVDYRDSFVGVSVCRLDAASYEVKTKNIAAALSPFGEVRDIVFTRWGSVTDSRASIILDLKPDKHLPEKLQIGRNIVDVSSKRIAPYSCHV